MTEHRLGTETRAVHLGLQRITANTAAAAPATIRGAAQCFLRRTVGFADGFQGASQQLRNYGIIARLSQQIQLGLGRVERGLRRVLALGGVESVDRSLNGI